jgi:hypothetical protein
MLFGDQEVLGKDFDFGPASPPLRIIYKAGAGTVHGSVQEGAANVLLLPQNGASQLVRATTSASDGKFEIRSVAPGDYYAVAFSHSVQSADVSVLVLPDFLGSLSGRMAVHVETGSTASLNLRLAPWPK